MSKALLTFLVSFFLTGCAHKVVLHPQGSYQEGRYLPPKSQPAYYDIYGNLHTGQDLPERYQEPRFHRAAYDVDLMNGRSYWAPLSSAWWSQSVMIGAASGAAIANLFDGGLSNLLFGAAVGGASGHVLEQQLSHQVDYE